MTFLALGGFLYMILAFVVAVGHLLLLPFALTRRRKARRARQKIYDRLDSYRALYIKKP